MSNKKISELSELTTPTTTDVFPVVNAGTTKKAQLGNLPISTATQTALDAKEATANKSTDVVTDQASNTKYPSVKAVYDWVVGLLTGKQDTLVSGTNIKTVNSTSLLGSGDISITASAAWGGITGTLSNQTDLQNALNGKQIIPYIQSNQASPVIHASDDVNTGVNWTLADTLDLVAGGSSKVRINQTGVTNITVNNSTYISGTELGYLDGVTSAIQTQIDGKQATLVSGTNIKTINSTSLLGSGDISISANPGGSDTQVQYNSSGSFAGSANLTFDGSTLISTGGGSSTTNTAVGSLALLDNTTGTNNTAFGKSALENNTASNNTAVGYEAAYSNTSGTGVVAVGYQALRNSTGANNTALGYISASQNTTGNNNTSIGFGSLLFNQTGSSNTAIGRNSLYNNTASNNTAVGYEAAYSNTSGTGVTAVGYQALRANTTGLYNTAIGYQALLNSVSTANNTAVGYQALTSQTTGRHNVAVGRSSLISNVSGEFNVAVGTSSGSGNTSGFSNSCFGDSTNTGNFSGSTILGRGATATGNNQFVVGSAAVNAGAVDANSFTQSNRWKVKINGVDYYIPLETV